MKFGIQHSPTELHLFTKMGKNGQNLKTKDNKMVCSFKMKF